MRKILSILIVKVCLLTYNNIACLVFNMDLTHNSIRLFPATYQSHRQCSCDDFRKAQKEKQAIAVNARLEVTAAPGIP